MPLDFSFIIPVYNRPEEVEELLHSFSNLSGNHSFEIVIVEDGSTLTSKEVINTFLNGLLISYYFKENSGPGDSRNYGMQRAKGNYFIILDSDCILPPQYLNEVIKELENDYVDCFGGPDAAHESFSTIQKAINFSMTSFLTTGGIRGRKDSIDKFQPRSFNMGISKKAFQLSEGFGRIHPGEDPDLSIRLEKLGFETRLFSKAFVYHKRRISWSKFYNQVNKFGLTRPILNKWYPETKKVTYWFPSLFVIGLLVSIGFAIAGFIWFLNLYLLYFVLCLISALIITKDVKVTLLVFVAIIIQFFGYGFGFVRSTIILATSHKSEEELFPNLFFSRTE